MADVQGYFERLWNLQTGHRPVRFGERDTTATLLDLGTRMLAVLCAAHDPSAEVLAVAVEGYIPNGASLFAR